jgi:hypothetical protein
MVVVPPPVIAFDWLLPGVEWSGVAWRGVAWRGVAWWCHTIDSCLQPHLLFSMVVWRATASFPFQELEPRL